MKLFNLDFNKLLTNFPSYVNFYFLAVSLLQLFLMETYLTAWKQASFGEYEGLKSIIDKKGGVKFDETDDRGFTPLCWAARNGHLQVMSYLIDLGCDKEIASFGGMRRKRFIYYF